MIVLDTTTRSLEVLLAGAIATSQLPVAASYEDQSHRGQFATNTTQTNGTTAVTAVAAPGSGAQRLVIHLSVYNADTAAATATVRLNDNGTPRTVVKATLAVGDVLIYTAGEGFRVLDTNGQLKGTGSGGGGYTDENAQDAIGGILADTSTIDFTYADATPEIRADVKDNSVTYAQLQDVSATARVLARKTAGAGDAEECTLSEILDFIGSAAQGDILYRGASSWARLAAGASGQVLKTQGAGANPQWAAEGAVAAATQAEMEAAASTSVYASPGRTHYHPGTAKAWVNFTGSGTVTINVSYNVTSITDNGTGDYTVNFTTSFSSANYCYTGMTRDTATGNADLLCCAHQTTAPTASALRFLTISTGGLLVDADRACIACFGDF